MDPIVLLVLSILLLILVLRVFFGLTKMLLKVGLLIVVAIILWRVFFAQS